MEQLVELQLPNILGAEKAAIEKAVAIAREMGFGNDRIEDLKTAVAEACINAIEHGNKFDKNKKFVVIIAADETSLQVDVLDEGEGIDQKKIPKKRVNENGFPKRRGYGVFLISRLMDDFSFEKIPGGGNSVKMLLQLNR
jgi:serine/threonine-protein kinase RsbW